MGRTKINMEIAFSLSLQKKASSLLSVFSICSQQAVCRENTLPIDVDGSLFLGTCPVSERSCGFGFVWS